MKRLLLFTSLLAVVGVLAISYRSRTMAALAGDMTDYIAQIEDTYTAFVEQHVFALEQEARSLQAAEEEQQVQLTGEQERLFAQLRAFHKQLGEEGRTPLQRLNTIRRMQTALHRLVRSFSGHPLRKSRSLIALEQEIGERGKVRELLRAYNAKAKLWNNRVQGRLGSLTAAVSNIERDLYPYLRFDGQAGKTQYIDFGRGDS